MKATNRSGHLKNMIESYLQSKDVCPFMPSCTYCDKGWKDVVYTGAYFDVKRKIHNRFACRKHTKKALEDVFIGNAQFVIDCRDISIICDSPNLKHLKNLVRATQF
jgi:hypothetical protein